MDNMELLIVIKSIMDTAHEGMMAKTDADRDERKAERKAYREEILANVDPDLVERKQDIRAGQEHLKEEMKAQMLLPSPGLMTSMKGR
jgi:hypothetical protein